MPKGIGYPNPRKAKKILRDGKVRGKALSPRQRRFMGAAAGGDVRKDAVKRATA